MNGLEGNTAMLSYFFKYLTDSVHIENLLFLNLTNFGKVTKKISYIHVSSIENVWQVQEFHIALNKSRHRQRERIVERKFLAADVEGIESVGAVGAVFEQVFLRLGELFAGLILAVIAFGALP